MSFRPFVRQIGFQPGVQLNPLADNTDGATPDNADQIAAMVVRCTRGPIDKPFRVHRGNLIAKTGPATPIRSSALNEAKIQMHEAVNNGAVEVVVARLVPAAAVKRYALVTLA